MLIPGLEFSKGNWKILSKAAEEYVTTDFFKGQG